MALAEGSGAGARDLAAWRERMPPPGRRSACASAAGTNGSVVVGSDVEVELLATLGPADARRRARRGRGRRARRRRRPYGAHIVPAVPAGAVGQEQRFVATMPAGESGRLAYAARVVPLRPDGARTEPQFLIAWEPPG